MDFFGLRLPHYPTRTCAMCVCARKASLCSFVPGYWVLWACQYCVASPEPSVCF